MEIHSNRDMLRIFFFLGFIAVVITFFSFLLKDEETTDRSIPEKAGYASVTLPETLTFAGENVPMTQIEVKEALDRELLINTYWHSQTILLIKRANRYLPTIDSILLAHGVPSDFRYIPVIESNLFNTIVSPSQAAGFWQFLAPTAKEFGLVCNNEVDERYNYEKATEAAARYLLKAYQKLGSWTLAAASYNAGINRIETAIAEQNQMSFYDLWLNDETHRYIYRVLAMKLVLENPVGYGFVVDSSTFYSRIAMNKIRIDSGIPDLIKFSNELGVSYKTLKLYNPWLRDKQLTNLEKREYYLSIPQH